MPLLRRKKMECHEDEMDLFDNEGQKQAYLVVSYLTPHPKYTKRLANI